MNFKLLWILPVFAAVMITCCGTGDRHGVGHSNMTLHHVGDTVKIHVYDSLSIPHFFAALFENHKSDLLQRNATMLKQWLAESGSIENDSSNQARLEQIHFLHEIFTASNASNGSRGELLNIPYFWHWVNPNPRHVIMVNGTGKRLAEFKPPHGYGKYATYADVDRTPYLFLSELFADKPKYYTENCDSFSTFGWCSEREMAFVALTGLLGFESKVVVSGNHSWSEVLVPLYTSGGHEVFMLCQVDNTFDGMELNHLSESDLKLWRADMGKSGSPKWYNDKAHSTAELDKIKSFYPSSAAMSEIERSVATWLKK